MRYVEALETYEPKPGEISLFLAGGITNCYDWHLSDHFKEHILKCIL